MKCIIIEDNIMSTEILQKFIARNEELELIAQFENPILAISFLNLNHVDLIFLDVEMPEMTGMEFINAIGENLPNVILTTSHTEVAIEAFKYNVSGFLVKPINYDQFYTAVKKVIAETSVKKTAEFKDNVVFIKVGKAITKINKAEIKLLECIGDYVNIFTQNKKYTVHSSMKALESRFDQKEYLRVHRSYIIRLDAIEDIEDDSITFGQRFIPIGKTYKKAVYSRLNII